MHDVRLFAADQRAYLTGCTAVVQRRKRHRELLPCARRLGIGALINDHTVAVALQEIPLGRKNGIFTARNAVVVVDQQHAGQKTGVLAGHEAPSFLAYILLYYIAPAPKRKGIRAKAAAPEKTQSGRGLSPARAVE